MVSTHILKVFADAGPGNAGDLSICHLLDLGFNPFILASLGDSRLRGSGHLGTVIFDSVNFFEDFLKDADGSLGIIGCQHRSV